MGEVEVHALREVDLDVAEAEHIVLLGPSGSGKSAPGDALEDGARIERLPGSGGA